MMEYMLYKEALAASGFQIVKTDDLEKMKGNIHILKKRLSSALPRIRQSKSNDEFCREARAILESIDDPLQR